MNPLHNSSFISSKENEHVYKDKGNFERISNLKNSKTIEFFEYLYSYPPKFTIKCDSLDELTQDLFLENNYGVLEHSFPFIDFAEDLFFQGTPQKAVRQEYKLNDFVDGYFDKLYSSTFYQKKTKNIQNTLASVPIFVIINGHKEIVLSKPINSNRSEARTRAIDKTLYEYCGAFNPMTESHPKLGFFFFSRIDAQNYLQEIAKSDIDGTKTVGLSVNCIGLNSAYRITREHHPGIDFRFVPDYQEVKTLLKVKLSKSSLIVDDEQQQLRFRPRSANLLPYFGKIGNWLLPTRSFLQKNEYFKGVPIYIVQVRKEPRNLVTEQYFTVMDKLDSAWGKLLQFSDSLLGFGHNWIMQGSLKERETSKDYINFIFFNEKDATDFVKKQGRKVARYSGSRTSNIELLVCKPKVFVYNLEDFLESWEENLLTDLSGKSVQTIFDANKIFFIPSTFVSNELPTITGQQKQLFLEVKQTLNLKYRLFKRYVGFLFSVGYA